MDIVEEEEDKMDVVQEDTPSNSRRRSSRTRKRVNYCELADRNEDDDDDMFVPNSNDDEEENIFIEDIPKRSKKRKKKKKTTKRLEPEIEESIDPKQSTFVKEMIDLAKSRRAKEKSVAVKRRTARAKTRSDDATKATTSYFDPRLSGGDISTAPQKILRKQFMRVWDLLSEAHLKHKDFTFGGQGLKFQTACSGTRRDSFVFTLIIPI